MQINENYFALPEKKTRTGEENKKKIANAINSIKLRYYMK